VGLLPCAIAALTPGHGLLDLMKEQAEAIKTAQPTGLTREPGPPEQEFKRQADAQMEQAKKTVVKIAGVFGAPVNKVASSNISKPKVVVQTPRCPKCQNVNISRTRVSGVSGDIEERCGACGWSQTLPGR
jgi:ribosomal protein L37AE/L43A